jgi:pimeloyl-ACP methyl ester carboxylesterase
MRAKFTRQKFWVILLFLCLSCWAARLEAQQLESRYIRRTAAADTVIVFIHGVFGDSATTWAARGGKAYWPDLIANDSTFDGANIYVYQYPTSVGVRLSIGELAEHMRLHLETSGVTAHKRIVFLAHSMGGLVTRAYLVTYRRVADRTAFVYFFSTPTTGSEIASIARLVFGTPQIIDMQAMRSDGYLANLQRQWLAGEFSFPSYCAYEARSTYGLAVVTQASATALCSKRLDPIDADHITIVKPAHENDQSYLAFKLAFKEVAAKSIVPSTPPSQVQSQPIEVHPNFKSVYSTFASELGRPRAPAQLSDDAYQAQYEQAHIVWIKPLLAIYVLPLNNEQRKAIRQHDLWTPNLDLFDDEKLRRIFETPSDKIPPHGGVANHRLKNPQDWEWIGWREWYCRFFNEVFYQEFDGGIMFGAFRAVPSRKEGRVFVVLNNGIWHQRITENGAPECRQIAEPFPPRT